MGCGFSFAFWRFARFSLETCCSCLASREFDQLLISKKRLNWPVFLGIIYTVSRFSNPLETNRLWRCGIAWIISLLKRNWSTSDWAGSDSRWLNLWFYFCGFWICFRWWLLFGILEALSKSIRSRGAWYLLRAQMGVAKFLRHPSNDHPKYQTLATPGLILAYWAIKCLLTLGT